MIKKIISFVLLLVMVLDTPFLYANAEENGNLNGTNNEQVQSVSPKANNSFEIRDGVLVKYNGSESEVVIPEEVYSIGKNAFSGNNTLTSVKMGNSVEKIEPYAFNNCTSLQNIVWSNQLKSIGDSAFSGCSSLKDLKLPGTLTTIGSAVFSRCNNLRNVFVPKSFPDPSGSYITYGPFMLNEADFKVTFEEGITRIPNSLFEGSAITQITIPDTIREIGDKSFLQCENLTTIKLPSNLQSLGKMAFGHCKKLESVWIPSSLQSMNGNFGYGPFVNCYALKYIEFQEGISSIPNNIFSGSGIEEITVPDTITVIGSRAFYDCSQLKKLVIPASVSKMGEECVGLSDNVTIYCKLNSAAHRYAVENGIPYEIEGEEVSKRSMPTFHVVDAKTLKDISGAKIYLTSGDNTYEVETNDEGECSTTLPIGIYNIQVEKEGYLTREFEYEFTEGEVEIPQIGLNQSSVVQGTLNVTEMSQDEIRKAGIDTNDPDNQHVFKYQITLSFHDGLEIYEIPIISIRNNVGKELTFLLNGKKQNSLKTQDKKGNKINVTRVNEYMYMVIQGEAKWQKEMFHAQLLILNTSKTEDLKNCAASIELPDGLSLADMNTSQQQETNIEVGTIKKESCGIVDWYIRGDKPGDYELKATLKGQFSGLGDKFSYVFKTKNPLHVYAGTDMQLTVHLSDAAYYQEPYVMVFELENVSDHTIYNVSHQVKQIAQYQVEYTWTKKGDDIDYKEDWDTLSVKKLGSDGLIEKDAFHPGEKLFVLVKTDVIWQSPLERLKEKAGNTKKLLGLAGGIIRETITIPGVSPLLNLISYIDVRYYLTSTMVAELEGSTAEIPIQFDVQHQKGINIFDKAISILVDDLVSLVKDNVISPIVKTEEGNWNDFVSTMFKGAKNVVEVDPVDDNTECTVWVESADGYSDVISIDVEDAKKDKYGRYVFKGKHDISVTALNKGEAMLVTRDEKGNLTKKQFNVKESFPGQENLKEDMDDLLKLGKVIVAPGIVVTQEIVDFLNELDMDLTKDELEMKSGDSISTGTEIKERETSESISFIVPGDTNSDSAINIFDSYQILDASNQVFNLSEQQKAAGDFNYDGKNDIEDVEYLLDYLIRPSTDSRSIGSQKINLKINDLVEDVKNIRGIQIDISNVSKNGVDSISSSNNLESDFNKSDYNKEGDYLRIISASFNGKIEQENGIITVQYNCENFNASLPVKIYIQTDTDTIVKETTISLESENTNSNVDQEHDRKNDELNDLLDRYEQALENAEVTEEKRAEFGKVIEEIKESLTGRESTEELEQYIEKLNSAYYSFVENESTENNDNANEGKIPSTSEQTQEENRKKDTTKGEEKKHTSEKQTDRKKGTSEDAIKEEPVKTGERSANILLLSILVLISGIIIIFTIRKIHSYKRK